MPYIIHSAIEGERWDTLASRYYGNAHRYQPIIDANKALPIKTVFEGGERVFIPILSSEETKPENLPPWKK